MNFFSLKTLSIKGKLNREQYIFAHFCLIIISFLLDFIINAINPGFVSNLWMVGLTTFMFMLVILFPLYVVSIVASVKRLNDIKKPWYIIIPVIAASYVPYIGIFPYFIMIIILSVIKGRE